MTNLGQLKCSPIPVRTSEQRLGARQTPHKFISLADTLSGISGMALGIAIDLCYYCGENRLKESSQHYEAALSGESQHGIH